MKYGGQISVIDKTRLLKYENKVSNLILQEIEDGLKLILGIN